MPCAEVADTPAEMEPSAERTGRGVLAHLPQGSGDHCRDALGAVASYGYEADCLGGGRVLVR